MNRAQRPERFDVAIVGGGLAGLLLARALSASAPGLLRIALLDRGRLVPERADIRAYAVAAGPRRMLERLGLWARIAPDAEPVRAIDIADAELNSPLRLAILHYDNTLDDGAPATHIVPHEVLLAAACEDVCRDPGITRHEEATISAFGDCGRNEHTRGERAPLPGFRRIACADGRCLEARLIVGADGRGSSVRRLARIKTVEWGYGQAGIVTTVAHERPHEGCARQHFLPGGPFAILPLKGNRSSLVWSEEKAEAARIMALDEAGFLAELRQRFGRMLGEIALAGPRASWPLAMHLARRFVAHRVALVGDAAHGIHPLAGQGLNLGLRDVAALAEIVIEAARLGLDVGSPLELARYERWRRFDATLSAFTFDAINRLFTNDNPLARMVRDFALGLVERTPALKGFFVREAAGLTGALPRLFRGEPI